MTLITRRSALAALAGLALSGCRSGPRVVLYCSQDREFALGILDDFRKESGLEVTPKFDTEANKSVGNYVEIVAEKGRPRCDVFWNNEVLNTIRLQRQGLLEPYDSPSAKPYPDWARADDHSWHAFASRARVLIVNTKLLAEEERPKSLLDLTHARYRDRVVMAKPQFGTTATQAACLFEVLGPAKAKDYYRRLNANGVQLAPGNKQVAEWVGQGVTPRSKAAAVGVTDTDDAMDEVRAGREVAVIFPDAGGGGRMGTLFIPNTVMIVKGCPNPDGARKLVDYLLSEAVESRLAEGPSAQIPLNPQVKAELPPQIEAGRKAKAMRVDWGKAADLWDQSQEFLVKEFASA
jgi:iron(III) transport system substrate-binding protein